MATLDYTGDGGAYIPDPKAVSEHGFPAVMLYRRVTISDVIAADADMTSNGYITANDIIQILDVPIGFAFERCVVQIITACSTDVNIEIGLAGGAEALASSDMDAAAGTFYSTIETDSWAGGKVFSSADTIDIQFITANCAAGDFEVWVFGRYCKPTSA